MWAPVTRSFFVCGVLLVLVAPVFAAGEYQHTKNGRTMVWNNAPKPGDEAAWWGDRDREGYATGFGTLTWYTGRKQTAKHLGILPAAKSAVYARYYGNMVRGKFNGPVNVHAKGKTNHAVFIDGVRSSRWAAGRAPSRMPEQNVELARRAAAEVYCKTDGEKIGG